jgi:hypothetical protein
MHAFLRGIPLLAVLLLVLFAMVRCPLTTSALVGTAAMATSAEKGPPVAGSGPTSEHRVRVTSWTDGLPAIPIEPPMDALSVTVFNEDAGTIVWSFVTEAFTPASGATLSGRPVPVNETVEHREVSIEDRSAVKQGTRSIGSFVYGTVPSGFRQLVPSEGNGLALQAGARYFVSIRGIDSAIRLPLEVPLRK